MSNPYIAPKPNQSSNRKAGLYFALRFLLPCIGGSAGFMGYIITAQLLESSVMPNVAPPKFTYGQQAGLISLPLSTVVGFFAGVSFALLTTKMKDMAWLAMLGVAILGSLTAFRLWYNDGIGECNSAIVLYYPIFGLCALVATAGFFAAIARLMFSHSTNQIAG